MMLPHAGIITSLHASGVDDAAPCRHHYKLARLAARMMMPFQAPLSILFSMWVTSIEQKWVSFHERRRI
jgi:hypothetical protein